MASVKTLLDLAKAKYLTDAAVGRAIGASHTQMADYRAGRKTLSPETVASLCDALELSGDECREWVAVSMIENPKNEAIAAKLRRALFACWAIGVAALMQPNEATARSGAYPARVDCLYIVAHWMRRWLFPLAGPALRA